MNYGSLIVKDSNPGECFSFGNEYNKSYIILNETNNKKFILKNYRKPFNSIFFIYLQQ